MRKRNALVIEERQKKILEVLKKKGKLSVNELCKIFQMSVVTIRNDLILLEENGLAIRTHGGAIAVQNKNEGLTLPFDIREERYFENKHLIGKAAAEMVNDGEVIFIDGGTTASEMRHYLTEKKDVTVITPSIVVTYWLAVTSNLNIYVLNGFFKRESYSTVGAPSMDTIGEWNVSKAFFGAAGFTSEEGLSDLNLGFVEQKKVIAKKAKTIIGLIDASKWGVLSMGSFASTDEIDIIITDKNAPEADIEISRSMGIDVRLV